jgi:2-oxo-4-hydroxy-4-carboxy-5-ureidoimidazoline decarboxylase
MSDQLNPDEGQLRACCAADAWVKQMAAHRPFSSVDAALAVSDEAVRALDDTGLDQALGAHARIGERPSGDGVEDRWSRREQAGALAVETEVQQQLAEGNRGYEERFGRVFLIRAAGRSAEEMLAALEQRLDNDDETERAVVLDELAQIVRLRLQEVLSR